MFEFTMRDFCYLLSLYKIQWKVKWKLEFLGQSEGIFLERVKSNTIWGKIKDTHLRETQGSLEAQALNIFNDSFNKYLLKGYSVRSKVPWVENTLMENTIDTACDLID